MKHTGNISSHFSWFEVEHSELAERMGIDNSIPVHYEDAAKNTARNLEIIRNILGTPFIVSSWYRCPSLQALPQFINPTSQHPRGEAVDFVSPQFGNPLAVCKEILKYPSAIQFDQLILEYSWVHISYNSIPRAPQRGIVLTLLPNKKFVKGLTDSKGFAV